MVQDGYPTDCSPFIAAGGFRALKICSNDIQVSPRQCGEDPAEDIYVDVCFTYVGGYEGPSFGETNALSTPEPNGQATPLENAILRASECEIDHGTNSHEPLSSLPAENYDKTRIQAAQVLSFNPNQDGENESDDGSLEAISLLRQEKPVHQVTAIPSESVSLTGKREIGLTSQTQTESKGMPGSNEPSDCVAATGISHLRSLPNSKHRDVQLHASDVESKTIAAASPTITTSHKHAAESQISSKSVDGSGNASGNTGDKTLEHAKMETKGEQHQAPEQQKHDGRKSETAIGLRRKNSVTRIFKILRRSLSREKSGPGPEGQGNGTSKFQERSHNLGESIDSPTDSLSRVRSREFSVHVDEEAGEGILQNEMNAEQHVAEVTGSTEPAKGNVLVESPALDSLVPDPDCSLGADGEAATAPEATNAEEEEEILDNALLMSIQDAKKFHKKLSVKRAIDAVRKVGSVGERPEKKRDDQAQKVHPQKASNTTEKSIPAPSETVDNSNRDREHAKSADVKRVIGGSQLHRRMSIKKAVGAVRRFGSAGKQESKENGDRLENNSTDVDIGGTDANAVLLEGEEDVREENNLTGDAWRAATNATRLHRKLSIQKVVHAVRRIGSAGIPEGSPKAAHKLSHDEHGDNSQTVAIAREEAPAVPVTVKEESVEDRITAEHPSNTADPEQVVKNGGGARPVENPTKLHRRFSLQKAVEAVKRIGSENNHSRIAESQADQPHDRAHQASSDRERNAPVNRATGLKRLFSFNKSSDVPNESD